MAKSQLKISTPRIPRATREINRIIKGQTLLLEIASFVRSRIYAFTKRGLSLARNRENPDKIKALSPRYVKWRRSLSRKKAKVRTGYLFAPGRSNLTLTGQMLDALRQKATPAESTIEVFVENSRRREAGRYEDELTNAQVARKVAENGRPFLGLDRTGRDRIRRMVIAELRRALKRGRG